MIIIGITGTLGAGKGTVVDYLVQKYHFVHFSVRDFLIEEVSKRNLPQNRDSFTQVANDLRRLYSPSYIVDQLYERAAQQSQNAIIESIRTPGEIDSLKQKADFILLAVDAQTELRYQRVVIRNSETDHIDFETFKQNEQREMNSSDPYKQNLGECIRRAHFILNNDGNVEQLQQQVDKIIKNNLQKTKN